MNNIILKIRLFLFVVVALSTFAVVYADDSLVMHLDFDDHVEGSDTVYDSSQYGNDCTLVDAEWSSTSGQDGKGAFLFDGVDDYINCGSSAVQDYDQITVMAWIKPLYINSSDFHVIVGGNARLYLDIRKGKYRTYTSLLSDKGIVNTYAETDIWTHVAFTYDGSIKRLYIDSEEVKSEFAENSVSPTNIFIGKGHVNFPRIFDGYIDDVRIYNRGLSAEEVLGIFEGPQLSNESSARSAIDSAVANILSGYDLREDQKVHIIGTDDSVSEAVFDRLIIENNRWYAINYLSGSDSPSGIESTSFLSVLELADLPVEEIQEEVEQFLEN